MNVEPYKTLVKNLRGFYNEEDFFYIPREEALNILKKSYKVDFGYDADAWEQWLDKQYYPSCERKTVKSTLMAD